MKTRANKAFALVCGTAAAIIVVGAMSLIDSRQAAAKPEFAAQTGKPCGTCHENPAGGGKLKSFGEKFKANGFKLSK
jgi:cytochrome c553